jgi:hypothetical protein
LAFISLCFLFIACRAAANIDLEIAMTKPFISHDFEVVTASAAPDPSNNRRGLVRFVVDAHFYSFALDRAALQRLSRQIDRLLRDIPPPARKR